MVYSRDIICLEFPSKKKVAQDIRGSELVQVEITVNASEGRRQVGENFLSQEKGDLYCASYFLLFACYLD